MKFTSFVSISLMIVAFPFCNNKKAPSEVVTSDDSSHIEHSATRTTAVSQTHYRDTASLLKESKEPNTTKFLETHLKDTLVLNGAFMLFLRPDSLRFESLKDEPGIYEGDADFGVGISNTIKGVLKNKKYQDYKIKVHTTDKRYISIKDCYGCPFTLDRDSVDYGYILSSYGRSVETKFNEVHSGDYMLELKEYFGF